MITCDYCEIDLSPEEVELKEVCGGDYYTPADYINTCPFCNREV